MSNFYGGGIRLKDSKYFYRSSLVRCGLYKYKYRGSESTFICTKLKLYCTRQSECCIGCPLLCHQRVFAILNEPKALKRCANCLERFDCYTGNYG